MPRAIAVVASTLMMACRPDPPPEQPIPASEEPSFSAAEPEPPPKQLASASASASASETQLRWELGAEPTSLTMAQRDRFVIELAVTNEGSKTLAPQLHAGGFQVDGQPHAGLDLWFSNGAITREWMALAPGQTARLQRKPGEHLFEAPGEYVLSYVHEAAVTSVTVSVTK